MESDCSFHYTPQKQNVEYTGQYGNADIEDGCVTASMHQKYYTRELECWRRERELKAPEHEELHDRTLTSQQFFFFYLVMAQRTAPAVTRKMLSTSGEAVWHLA